MLMFSASGERMAVLHIFPPSGRCDHRPFCCIFNVNGRSIPNRQGVLLSKSLMLSCAMTYSKSKGLNWTSATVSDKFNSQLLGNELSPSCEKTVTTKNKEMIKNGFIFIIKNLNRETKVIFYFYI